MSPAVTSPASEWSKSMQASSETIAGDGVADRQREEDECDGDHGDIQHEMILSTPTVIESKLLFRGARNRAELRLLKRLRPQASMSCHLRHMFSRWIDGQRYRNLIRIGGSPPPACPCAPLGIDPIPIKLRRFSYEIPTSRALAPSRFFMAVCPSSPGAANRQRNADYELASAGA
jgi:hypothetical protein